MLVGTAMTGQSARPPMTLARAPSIPAMAMITRALMMVSICATRRCRPATPTSLKPFYLVSQGLGCQGCLLSHRDIAGPSSGDHDRADSVLFRKVPAYADPGTVQTYRKPSIFKLLFQEIFRMTGLFRSIRVIRTSSWPRFFIASTIPAICSAVFPAP